MNNLYNTRCYLAGNIQNSSDIYEWRKDITDFFKTLGIISLDPTKDMFEGSFSEDRGLKQKLEQLRSEEKYVEIQDIMKEIVRKDLRAIDICDFAIFCLEPDKPTYGTIHELINCAYDRKPILILIPSKKQMPFWLLRYTNIDCIFENISDLKNYIKNIDSGAIKLDNKYWKILKGEFRTI